ncbi:chromosomal replication initiator protein DnaA [Megalodesulfovibrio gigas]|uniref:Chromosomal replication initiator protein DnaA n=1 Tax=Megalodesulfovibrio gigas (strain ATCC 19364 / DSM 1382 / NCIMB 9332 / VKM B-1759) TaxID=1121448 RepID=T2GGG3_MEGG1|nr:chromosomal replication initiator protein DnaA [Megalodesulfovibrio gigas]AGW15132.1 putative chromosomal replication initiator protein DnaA [Megalodesulfovibrio gigas DSM 1382 = ATCC 19364]
MNTHWDQIRQILQKTVNPGLFQVWIAPLTAVSSGPNLCLKAPNEFVAIWVRDRLLEQIRQAAVAVLGRQVEITVSADPVGEAGDALLTAAAVVGSGASSRGGSVSGGAVVARPAPLPRSASHACSAPTGSRQLGLPLQPDAPRSRPCWQFSFDDFVVGPSNQLAYAASRALCDKQLESEQVFLSSTPGLGKTHLLQAVGRSLCSHSNRQQARVEYLTAEEFGRLWVQSLRSNELERFKARFREGVDLLLLEDVHFFQGKEKMQDELLSTMKALRNRGAKVILTSSFLPRELKDVDSTLASRFCSGFLAVIEKPGFETRKRILEQKAKSFHVALPNQVTELLAERINTDIRQLESCLQNLILKARLLNHKITLELACEVLSHYEPEIPHFSMDRIIDFVCDAFELSPTELRSKSRQRQIVQARNAAYFLARKHTELSLQDIGNRFNRKHSTVIKGITNIEREMNLETPVGRQLSRTVELAKAYCRVGAR